MFPLRAADTGGSNGQAVQTTLTVKELFNYIEKNSNFVILYSKGLLSELNRKVSINTNGKNAEEILRELAAAANLEFKISDRQVTVTKKAPAVAPSR